jgi:hypothetical protein
VGRLQVNLIFLAVPEKNGGGVFQVVAREDHHGCGLNIRGPREEMPLNRYQHCRTADAASIEFP